MLHLTYGSRADFYVTTEEKRIDTSAATTKVRLLFKFTNDMDKRVVYAYGDGLNYYDNIGIYQRYTKASINHNTTENVYTGSVDFKPFGYWKYEIYEVTWQSASVVLGDGTAPVNENDVLSPADTHKGVVQGKVEEGKLYVTETAGSEQIKYTEHTEASGTNYIWTN